MDTIYTQPFPVKTPICGYKTFHTSQLKHVNIIFEYYSASWSGHAGPTGLEYGSTSYVVCVVIYYAGLVLPEIMIWTAEEKLHRLAITL